MQTQPHRQPPARPEDHVLLRRYNEDSDVDTSGLFIAKKESLLDLGIGYQDQVSDERNDTTWYEIGKFCNMLLKSNPTVLEALFVPEDKIITTPSDIVRPLFENRDQFITKECF
ncbi:MAG: nucleotidyltransferase domain-containing protein, partial [Lachnospiraceae bacterium]|nr:nucleotidyltransferase domain-containing protein [Lachnospiraceae bacterium]